MAFINDLIAQLESTGKLKVRKPDGTLVSSHQLDIREADGKRYTVWKGRIEITYKVDSNTTYQEYVYYGIDLLSPTTFTPSKSGYTFVGWRTDNAADSSVLTGKTCEYEPVTLYAVFKRTNTLTYYDNSTTEKTTTRDEYYNNGNYLIPQVKLTQSVRSGWTARGWSTSTASDASASYNDGEYIQLDGDKTLYGLYYRELTWTFISYNSTQTASGTRYYNSSGNGVAAKITAPTGASYSGWTWRGWSNWTNNTVADADVTYSNGQIIDATENGTVYGLYRQYVTLTYYDGSSTAATKTGYRYYNAYGNTSNPSFIMNQAARAGWTTRGWSTSTEAKGTISYSNGAIVYLAENMTLYGCYSQTITITYYNNSTTSSTTSGTRYWNSAGNYFDPTFTIAQASRSGWTARGWSTSTAGNAGVSHSSISGTSFSVSATLYGLYYKTCTLTAKSYNSTQTATGTAYYNSAGNTTNATATVPSGATYSGWTWRGWSTGTGANADVGYANGSTYTLGTSDATIYGLYYQTITISYNGNGATGGSTASHTATRYYNAYGSTSNPTVTLATNGFTRSNYKFVKWASGSASGTQYSEGGSVQLSASTTFYAIWEATAVPIYWFNRITNSDGTESQILTSGYQGEWDTQEWCCDDASIGTEIWHVQITCNNHTAQWKGTASGATGGNPYATICITEFTSSGGTDKLIANGTEITSAGTYTITLNGASTLSLTLWTSHRVHINYIYFHG